MAEATAYATVAELVTLLKVQRATNEPALISVLEDAAKEIDSEIGGVASIAGGWSDDPQALSLLRDVNLERAQDLWASIQVGVGVLGLGSETPLIVPRNSWERFANRLAPLKDWTDAGIA